MIDVVLHHWGARRSDIAGLSPVVVAAAAQGDSCAQQILTDAAGELVSVVDACRHKLDFTPDGTVPVSYSGGVFTAGAVLDAFTDKLTALGTGYDLRTPLYPSVVGAAFHASRLSGHRSSTLLGQGVWVGKG